MPAAVVLPVWILVGYGVFGETLWLLPLVIVLAVAAAVSLAGVGMLAKARAGVKSSGALSWPDVALFAAWWVTIAAAGFASRATGALVLLAAALAVVTFWVVLVELFSDARRALRDSFEAFGRQAQPAPGPDPRAAGPLGSGGPARVRAREPRDDGEYIVVREQRRG